MTEILKESNTKKLYTADEPYTGIKTPEVKNKVKTTETDLTIKEEDRVQSTEEKKDSDSLNPIEFIEKHYPETAKEFKSIQQEQYEVFCKKQMDYGPSNISMGTGVGEAINKKLSTTALVIRINDKIQRLLNLVVSNDRDAQNEPVEDAFKDLSVYGIIAQIVRNGKWGI
tara:strand:+ start:186 stop:695 length:510 start_codon:yes stop_codon:yes gene_type:complete